MCNDRQCTTNDSVQQLTVYNDSVQWQCTMTDSVQPLTLYNNVELSFILGIAIGSCKLLFKYKGTELLPQLWFNNPYTFANCNPL